ncbi:hypothetical protein ACHAXT_002219 [Thalassiosira profunda]
MQSSLEVSSSWGEVEEAIMGATEVLVSEGQSLENIINQLYRLPPWLPTFMGELATQKVLDRVWSRIDKTQLHEDRVKVLKKERLERLPSIQMESIRRSYKTLLLLIAESKTRETVPTLFRDDVLLNLSKKNDREAMASIWYLALWKQLLDTPLNDMTQQLNDMTQHIVNRPSLNEFLDSAPLFRVGFNATSKGMDAMDAYIVEHIEPELNLISIGVTGAGSDIEWRRASPLSALNPYLMMYEAVRGISLKSFVVKHNGRVLFSGDLKRSLNELSISDGDIVTLSARASWSEERIPLKPIHDENKRVKSHRAMTSRHSNRNKGSGKKQNLYASPEREMDLLKQQHSEAMSLVFEEVGRRFREIRERLSALTLQRTLPKVRSKAAKLPPLAAPISNPPAGGIAGKAGKTSFLVLVGDAENLYKTSKKSKGKKLRQPKSGHRARGRPNTKVDLHGLTKEQALAQLDQLLPGWVDTAMKSVYPFRINVQIVCGGGYQVLADAVAAWIRRQTNVAIAPKSGS